jgi:large subunit ribosomal protein L25
MSTEDFKINALPRSDTGKGASRRLRRQGLIPGILYGGIAQEPVMLSVRFHEFSKHLANEAFYSHILTLNLNDQSQQVVLKDLQRHPTSGNALHFDLQRVSESQQITMNVPLHFINEDICVGVKLGGGGIAHQLNEVEIRCFPKDLPEFIEVDMKDAAVGDVLHLSDLVLPAGVELVELLHGEAHDQPVVSVSAHGGGHAAEDDEESTTT